ncbi:MAG: 2-hydroxyglutaryl-CoA dehydratase [Myxococcota bacterium]
MTSMPLNENITKRAAVKLFNILGGAVTDPQEEPVQHNSLNVLGNQPLDYEQIEAEVAAFETQERERLGIKEEKINHWFDANPQRFTKDQKETTTLLVGGLTQAQDYLAAGALAALGYKLQVLEVPNNDALRYGKEFGNRGQCNPTYFTVGNLVKHLCEMRDKQGMSTEEIVENYLFLTAGACGPCRFGTYATEYRKALRDAGFEGFRVMLFQQQGGLKQATGEESGLELNPKFFMQILKSIMAGDVLNAVGYRIRPYEINKGDTNIALDECKKILHDALSNKKSILRALVKCRQRLNKVAVNRLQPKPKVSIIGEFWAMTTEGDGNYKLQQFLESEGAEVDIQLVSAWLLYNVWQHRFDTRRRMTMKHEDQGKTGLKGKGDPRKKLAGLWVADKALRSTFHVFAKAIGLNNYHLPDMEEIATISHQYYDNHLRGGEGHMEVGKLIQTVNKKKAHMVISVKPFGCMPSSGVSDGIQSLITTKYPEAIFCAIETTGDGAVNVQSRVQMDLFKARQAAIKEYEENLRQAGLSQEQAEKRLKKKGKASPLYYPDHKMGIAGTGATYISELAA